MRLAICWIGIGIYKLLFDEFYKSFLNNFCVDLQRTFIIFTDDVNYFPTDDNILKYEVSNACLNKEFVLFRKFKYLLMAEDKYINFDYCAFINGNSVCNKQFKSEQLIIPGKISCINHPNNINMHNKLICNPLSKAFQVYPKNWLYKQAGLICCNNFQFLKMINQIESWRLQDKVDGYEKYVPWHDETYYNKYIYNNKNIINILDTNIYMSPDKTENCFIYTRNKKQFFDNKNIQFNTKVTSTDIYTL